MNTPEVLATAEGNFSNAMQRKDRDGHQDLYSSWKSKSSSSKVVNHLRFPRGPLEASFAMEE
jgi:hypothetical protein